MSELNQKAVAQYRKNFLKEVEEHVEDGRVGQDVHAVRRLCRFLPASARTGNIRHRRYSG